MHVATHVYSNRMSTSQQPPWLTIGEAAERLGVSIATLRRWDTSGKLPASRDGNGRRVYPHEDLDTWHRTHLTESEKAAS